jgi:hypothetical protein
MGPLPLAVVDVVDGAVAPAGLGCRVALATAVRGAVAAPADPVVAATMTVPSMPGWNEHLYV